MLLFLIRITWDVLLEAWHDVVWRNKSNQRPVYEARVGFEDLSMRLVSILLPSRKDPRRRNLDPEEDKCRIQFPERNRLLNLLLIYIVECRRR